MDSNGQVTNVQNPRLRKLLFNAQESTLKDLTLKLPSIIGQRIVVAMLVIGFDSYDCTMDAAIEELIERAAIRTTPWCELYREWQNHFDDKYRTRCWFWYL